MFKTSRLITAGALAVVVILLGSIKFLQIQKAIADSQRFQPPPQAVTTIVTQPESWQDTFEFAGSVAATQGVIVSAEEEGRVTQIGFESGAAVKQGDLLIQLDVSVELATLKAAEARTELARVSLKRAKELFSKRANAQSELDTAEAQYIQALADAEAAKALMLRKTIRAPFSGITGIRKVNVGQYITSGTALVSVQASEQVYVNFSAPQSQLGRIKEGQTVIAVIDNGSGMPIEKQGKVSARNPHFDQDTRTAAVQAIFDNQDRALVPGMYAKVIVNIGEPRQVLTVPVSSINYAPYGDSLFVVKKLTSKDMPEFLGVAQQIVALGARRGDRIIVEKGISAGDEVVTSGVFKLRPNAPVKVNNSVMPSNSLTPELENN